ncbi:MAG: phosphatase [Verrucomicrobia bacterium]|nr:phosphatase [Verrucomicrobiota bacterium]
MPGPVAVVDVGSNSIKVLVAARNDQGGITSLLSRTVDARISAGISRESPQLSEAGMARGLEAIATLLAEAATHGAASHVLVATSAVRDARNGGEFRSRVRAATGHDLRILTGEEEANLIGRGLTCDATLRHLQDFRVFDLGGGSLEILEFRTRRVQRAVSLPLGCVRLTERVIPDATAPFSPDAAAAITSHVRTEMERTGLATPLPAGATAIGTGGSVATARAILGASAQCDFADTSPSVTVGELRRLLAWLGALPLDERRRVPGLPPARADVFPAALATLLAVADCQGCTEFHHSLCNLRYGLAAELLGIE